MLLSDCEAQALYHTQLACTNCITLSMCCIYDIVQTVMCTVLSNDLEVRDNGND